MTKYTHRQLVPLLVGMGLLLAVTGCAGSKQAGEEGEANGRRATAAPPYVALDLAAAVPDVRTIQLYRGNAESSLPIVALHGGEQLTLEFDLLADAGRPLSVYFYHADRAWRRDLMPSQYLKSFLHDNLLNYTLSLGTEVPFVHYAYQFPNDNIDFLISGNYVLRVTEQGREDEVLLERAFFVTEQQGSLGMAADPVLVGGYNYPFTQPLVEFTPPADMQGNVFDFSVCFVRNGRLEMARCATRPGLAQQPAMQFYLEPDVSFEPEGANYFLDLSNLRPSNQIVSTNRSVSPHRVVLEPDYARFGGDGLAPLMNGQPIISGVVMGVADPDIAAEYVQVRFSYVPPDEAAMLGEVIVTGSFNNWAYDPAYQLAWVPENGRYEGELLLKQGQYEYRYVARDRRIADAQRENMPNAENQYAAFVYYSDIRLNSDRLLAVRQVVGP